MLPERIRPRSWGLLTTNCYQLSETKDPTSACGKLFARYFPRLKKFNVHALETKCLEFTLNSTSAGVLWENAHDNNNCCARLVIRRNSWLRFRFDFLYSKLWHNGLWNVYNRKYVIRFMLYIESWENFLSIQTDFFILKILKFLKW